MFSSNEPCDFCGSFVSCPHYDIVDPSYSIQPPQKTFKEKYTQTKPYEEPQNNRGKITSTYKTLDGSGKEIKEENHRPAEEVKVVKGKGKQPYVPKPPVIVSQDPEVKRLFDQKRKENTTSNFYEGMPKKYGGVKYRPPENPHCPAHPAQICIIGKTGAMKTNHLLDLCNKSNCYDKIVIVTPAYAEPLYELIGRAYGTKCERYQNVNDLPTIEELTKKPEDQVLLVFDDAICEKKAALDKITEYYIRGRKGGGVSNGISTCFISQEFHKIPKTIRDNLSFIILKALPNPKEKKAVLSKLADDIDKNTFLKMFDDCAKVDGPGRGMMIDLNKTIKEGRFKPGDSYSSAFIPNENQEFVKETVGKLSSKPKTNTRIIFEDDEDSEPCGYGCKEDPCELKSCKCKECLSKRKK